jgi:hypothetical protein
MSESAPKPKEYTPCEHVCPDCRCKHWERGSRCAICEDQYQREQQYNYR